MFLDKLVEGLHSKFVVDGEQHLFVVVLLCVGVCVDDFIRDVFVGEASRVLVEHEEAVLDDEYFRLGRFIALDIIHDFSSFSTLNLSEY